MFPGIVYYRVKPSVLFYSSLLLIIDLISSHIICDYPHKSSFSPIIFTLFSTYISIYIYPMLILFLWFSSHTKFRPHHTTPYFCEALLVVCLQNSLVSNHYNSMSYNRYSLYYTIFLLSFDLIIFLMLSICIFLVYFSHY